MKTIHFKERISISRGALWTVVALLAFGTLASCTYQRQTAATVPTATMRAETGGSGGATHRESAHVAATHTKVRPATDEEIARAVERELFLASDVLADNVEVTCTEGIVTLSGEVDNALSKRSAVARASMVRGVRSIVDELTVRDVNMNDATLREHVSNALLFDPTIDSNRITVRVSDGAVSLVGRVPSWQERRLVERVVAGVRGVRSMDDDLSIDVLAPRTDEQIRNDVVARLRLDRWVDDDLLAVAVSGSRVNVTGTVGSVTEKNRVADDAWVAGVSGVDTTGVDVEPWADPSTRRDPSRSRMLTNDQVVRAVRDAFLFDPRVLSFSPDITADDGVVTLSGVVTSVAARDAATETAMNTIGVYRVRNQLRVVPRSSISDHDLEARVQAALAWNPFLERHEVTVDASGGHIYLYGDVDNRFERDEVGRVASAVDGVVAVTNMLEVRHEEATPMSDWAMQQEIASQLYWDPWVNSTNIHIQVEDGRAVLSGTVQDWRAFTSAIKEAYEAGAHDVVTRLTIDAPTPDYLAP